MKKLRMLMAAVPLLLGHGLAAQDFALSTNVLGYADFGTLNIEASYAVARHWSLNAGLRYNPFTFGSGEQEVRVEGEAVYLTISPVSVVRELTPEQGAELLAAYGLRPEQGWPGLAPALVNSGLTDIMLPVRDHGAFT